MMNVLLYTTLKSDKNNILFIYLGCIPDDARIAGKLDKDGFPPIGSKLEFGDPCYW